MSKLNSNFLRNKKLLVCSCFIAMSIFPISFTIANPILIKISNTVMKDITLVGFIFTFFSAGSIIGAGTSGIICKFFHRNIVLKIIYFLQVISFLLISFWINLYIFYLSFLLIGFCAGFISVQLSSIISEIYEGQSGLYLNMLHMFFGVGAFIGPYLSLLADKWNLGLGGPFYLAAALSFINFLFAIFVWMPESNDYKVKNLVVSAELNDITGAGNLNSIKIKYGYLMMVLLIFSIIFAFSSREGINYWMPTFLMLNRNFDQATAGKILSYFWIASIGGRFTTGLFTKYFKIEGILFFQSILCFLVAIAAIVINNRSMIFIFVLLIGFLNAGFFPSILAIGSTYYRENKSLVISVLTAFLSVGGFLATGMVSIVYKYFSLQAGLIIVSSLILGVSVIMMIIYMILKRKRVN